jgi:branched-chain amino acid transport system substrate-binding protein
VKRTTRWGGLAVLLGAAVGVAAVAGATGGNAATDAKKPIVIGWAFDSSGNMAPFDNPALAAAKIRVKQINAKGGVVGGRHLVIKTCNTQGNNPTTAKACAVSLLGQGSNIIFTTCDVDYATPVVQAAINRGVLAVAPCIGTDQMGPKRFAAKGKLAFSFGNVAQDEGSAMAQLAWSRGWKSAALATNTYLVYFKNVVQAFDKRFRQLGGKIVDRESYATGANNVNSAVTRLNSHKAAVYVTSTAFGELPAFVSGIRSLGNKTPILNSWAGDGTYWATNNPKVTNYWFVTFASVFGDDPSSAVRAMIASLKGAGAAPGTGGFLGGADAIDGVVTAIRRANGSTKGSALSAQLVKFKRVPVLGGRISFSTKLHTVYGRDYRVIQIQNNKASFKGLVRAKVIPKL